MQCSAKKRLDKLKEVDNILLENEILKEQYAKLEETNKVLNTQIETLEKTNTANKNKALALVNDNNRLTTKLNKIKQLL